MTPGIAEPYRRNESARWSRLAASPPEWKSTACILCECNCGLEVQLGGDDGRHLVKLRGDKRHPVVAAATRARRRTGSTTTRTAASG